MGVFVLMDGWVMMVCCVDDGFVFVLIDMGCVFVLYQNWLIGVMDWVGYLLVFDLNVYQNNCVVIDGSVLLVDVWIVDMMFDVVLQVCFGVFVYFVIICYSVVLIVLCVLDGMLFLLGFEVCYVESGQCMIVGYDGLIFVDGFVVNNYLQIFGGGCDCIVEFVYWWLDDGMLLCIGLLICGLWQCVLVVCVVNVRIVRFFWWCLVV